METYSGVRIMKVFTQESNEVAAHTLKPIHGHFDKNFEGESVNFSSHGQEKVAIGPLNAKQPCLISGSMDYNGDESALLEDVKICDICGDAGREELLAVCSNCSDGAEHIYCMSTRLNKVPEGDWICEDCVLSEDNSKRRQTEFGTSVAGPSCKVLDESCQDVDAAGMFNAKVYPEKECKVLNVVDKRRDEVSPLPSAKRPLGKADSTLLTKRRAFGMKNAWLRPSSNALKSKDCSIKRQHEMSMWNDSHCRSTKGDAPSRVSDLKLPKSCPLLTSAGALTKSKSFNVTDRRPKVQLLDKNPQNLKYPIENRSTKSCSVRSLKKSLSLSDANSSRMNIFDRKTQIIPPKSSEVCNLRRLRHVTEQSSVEMTTKTDLKEPQICLPDFGSSVPASSYDKKFASHCESTSPNFSAQDSRKSDNADVAEILCLRPSDIIQDSLSPPWSDSYQEPKHKGTSDPSLMLRRHLAGSDGIGQGLPTSENSSDHNQKALQASYFSGSCVCKSGGSGSTCCCMSKTLGLAACCDSTETSPPSVLDVNGSYSTNIDLRFCYQLNVIQSPAVPMFDYVWKGDFKIKSSGTLPGVLYRIQAHLSTQASPKIPEVVKKFTDKIFLEEVPRTTAWPTQFLECHPKDDSIGLYFFAEDIKSYSNYKSLLQYMIDYDIALKGNFNGIELLVFSSNLLPEKSQCWNKLLFLWGIFRERKFNNK